MPVLSMYWLSSVLNPMVLDLMHQSFNGSTQKALMMDNDYVRSCRPFARAIRAAYIFVNLCLPFAHHSPLTAASHVLLMGAVESLHLAMLFALSEQG